MGHPWESVVKGANLLINYVKTNHLYPKKVRLIIIIFNEKAFEVYNNTLDEPLGQVFNFTNGGTDFNPAFNMGVDGI
jgi:hypothetical protein